MFRVYSEFKAIVFASSAPEGARFVLRLQPGSETEPANLLQKVENGNTLWIIAAEPAAAFAEFLSRFRVVKAAGGVVSDPEGRVLMIYRNGVWDLPKGHVEPGEDSETGALREVAEECGLTLPGTDGLLTDTYHFYSLGGRWVMKKCSWYAMRYEGHAVPVPQTEEGITRAEWLGGARLLQAAAGSYATIRDVLALYLGSKE